jgi:hypothetical protein
LPPFAANFFALACCHTDTASDGVPTGVGLDFGAANCLAAAVGVLFRPDDLEAGAGEAIAESLSDPGSGEIFRRFGARAEGIVLRDDVVAIWCHGRGHSGMSKVDGEFNLIWGALERTTRRIHAVT